MSRPIAGDHHLIGLFSGLPQVREQLEAVGNEVEEPTPEHFRVTIAAKAGEAEGVIRQAGGAGNFDQIRSRAALGGDVVQDVEGGGVPNFPGGILEIKECLQIFARSDKCAAKFIPSTEAQTVKGDGLEPGAATNKGARSSGNDPIGDIATVGKGTIAAIVNSQQLGEAIELRWRFGLEAGVDITAKGSELGAFDRGGLDKGDRLGQPIQRWNIVII